ncbi:MAG TPA: hypothetical protein VJ579_04320 [Candidatus Paceibacterota bacterium]|nr:hypothetical protein [Candidatus Paceibacterota bacterium]
MTYSQSLAFFREQKAFSAFLSVIVIISSVGAVFATQVASAANLAFGNVTDTMSNARLSTAGTTYYSAHTFKFTPKVDITGGQAVTFTFRADDASMGRGNTGTNFDAALIDNQDVSIPGKVIGSSCGGGENFSFTTTATVLTLSTCPGNTIASTSPFVVTFGSSTRNMIKTPAPGPTYDAYSYQIDIAGPASQFSSTLVALVSNVLVSASVDPVFNFTISGLASSTTRDGKLIDIDTSTSSIAYGALPVGTPVTAAQELQVTTNAKTGFNVTVVADQPFQSSNGSVIDGFSATAGAPQAFVAPTGILADDTTWGHIALSTDDANIPGAATLSGDKWTGDFVRGIPVSVFGNASSTAGVGVGLGTTTVFYRTQISPLQEAATDYFTNLIYVATPTF